MNAAVSKGLSDHIAAHRRRLERGEARLGWKVAFNVRPVQQHLGLDGSLVAGLVQSTVLAADRTHSLAGGTRVVLEAEVAVRLKADVAPGPSQAQIAGAVAEWAPAIEVVDFDRPLEELEAILREGVFHRGVVLGAWQQAASELDLGGIRARVSHGGRSICDVDAKEATGDVGAVLARVSTVLAPFGEQLRAGDVVILGSMNPPTPAESGATFAVELSGVGSVSLALTA